MDQLSYKLDVFEGPMDLLLSLIAKHKLNIYDIPIVELVDQYLEYVRRMQDEDMYVASEFLEMAARLVYLKTVSLLPVHEEADELLRVLTGELIEYRDCKLMAEKLSQRTDGFDHFVRAPMKIETAPTYTRVHDGAELLRAYLAAAGRKLRNLPPPIEAFREIVAKKIVSVGSKIRSIYKKFASVGSKRKFTDLFSDAQSRSDMVATFLAVLELAKDKKVMVSGDGGDTSIELLSADFGDTVSEEWE